MIKDIYGHIILETWTQKLLTSTGKTLNKTVTKDCDTNPLYLQQDELQNLITGIPLFLLLKYLMLSICWIKISAGKILKYFSYFFPQTGFGISCNLYNFKGRIEKEKIEKISSYHLP